MATYLSNEILITGSKEDIATFRAELSAKEVPSLTSFWPLPKELENTVSPPGSAVWTDAAANISDLRDEQNGEQSIPAEIANDTVGKQRKLLEKYGYCDWHNWKINEWGAQFVENLEIMQEKDNMLIYKFTSANSPPHKLIQKVASMYDKLNFTLAPNAENQVIDDLDNEDDFRGEPLTNSMLEPPGKEQHVMIRGPDHGGRWGGGQAKIAREKDGNFIFKYLENHGHIFYGNQWQSKNFGDRKFLILSPGKFGYSPGGEILDIAIKS